MPRHRRGWAISEENRLEFRLSPLMGSFLEPALLTLLKGNTGHGYTLLAGLENLGLNGVHPSVVYRILREMEVLGWIRSEWDADDSLGPPRRIYSLTGQGEKALQNWKAEMERTAGLINTLLDKE